MVSTIRGDDGFDSARYVNLLDTYAGRNKIRNADMKVWQRGGGAFTSGYTADGWSIGNSGPTLTVNKSAPPVEQLENNTVTQALLTTVSGSPVAATTVSLVKQKIEDVKTLAGQTVTLTFWAFSSTGGKIGVGLQQVFGTGGSSGVVLNGQLTEALSSNYTKQTLTFTLPSVAGKTINAGDSRLDLTFFFSAGSNYDVESGAVGIQNGDWTITQVQLEAGDTPTLFETKTYGQDIAECQRFYQTYPGVMYGAQLYTSGTNKSRVIQWPYPVKFRDTPHTIASTTSNVTTIYSEISDSNRYYMTCLADSELATVTVSGVTISAEL